MPKPTGFSARYLTAEQVTFFYGQPLAHREAVLLQAHLNDLVESEPTEAEQESYEKAGRDYDLLEADLDATLAHLKAPGEDE